MLKSSYTQICRFRCFSLEICYFFKFYTLCIEILRSHIRSDHNLFRNFSLVNAFYLILIIKTAKFDPIFIPNLLLKDIL
jgi:hypothetical protein